ncbi:hypothetical protein WJM97_02325 [Okeanomitos corallinicola TIOX110]|uniref:Uncharacterized protein n=1 Tax=Okeanomitos corallinicola TIOX110 TaxID=3133117 RepID=A0ABZ2UTU9_9CYAN
MGTKFKIVSASVRVNGKREKLICVLSAARLEAGTKIPDQLELVNNYDDH